MNTINNRPNVTRSNTSFGMKFTPRAEEILIKEAGNLIGMTSSGEIVGKGQNMHYVKRDLLTNIKKMMTHKKTDDLTLDIVEGQDSKLRLNILFTKGSELKKGVKLDYNLGDSIGFANPNGAKNWRESLNEKYQSALSDFKQAQDLLKLSKRKDIKTKFADDSAKLIPELTDYCSAGHLETLFSDSPKRFKFKIAKENGSSNSRLFYATDKNPIFQVFNLGNKTYYANPKASILQDEKEFLIPKNKRIIKENMQSRKAKEQLELLFNSSKGLTFSNEAKKLILEADDITYSNLKKLVSLAKDKSNKNLTLDIQKSVHSNAFNVGWDNGQGPILTSEKTVNECIHSFVSKDFKGMNEYAAKVARQNKELAEKIARFDTLAATDAFKAKFYGDSTLFHLKDSAGSIDFAHLQQLINETPKLTFKIEGVPNRRGYCRFNVASSDYPKAGFLTSHTESYKPSLISKAVPKNLLDFAETSLKEAHNKAVVAEKASADLRSAFEKSRNR